MITHGTCFYESTQQLSLPSKHATLHNKIKHRPLTYQYRQYGVSEIRSPAILGRFLF